jgi:tRNA A-37 threonylcarbamoyl transferase component Bud32
MAELVIKSQCRSSLRQLTDATLNITFPLWGIASPIAAFFLLMGIVSMLHTRRLEQVSELLTCFILCMCVSFACLLTKRVLLLDAIVLHKSGIKLPLLIGSSLNFVRFIPWQSILNIRAHIDNNELTRSKIIITKSHGRTQFIPVAQLQPEFVEQLLLSSRMWAPDVCDASLEELQNKCRSGARQVIGASYTDLWEEELSRRFCPTAYIPLEPGRLLRNGSLKVIRPLASGGLSALYLCQLDSKQLVVLKEATVPQHSVDSFREKAKELFEREARLLISLNNPGIVRVLDFFAEADRCYLLLEYIDGADLRQLVKQNGAQREADVLDWAIQIAVTLKYLHEREQPIIHRDLTPDNIVLRNDGRVIIVDFGAANEFIGTATGTFVGKHAFIAPEQLRGKATVQSDIYAFGCTLYFLLTGAEPEALSESNPRSVVPNLSEELSELVESCTKLEASDRYQSIAQVLPVLRRLAASAVVL